MSKKVQVVYIFMQVTEPTTRPVGFVEYFFKIIHIILKGRIEIIEND